MNGGYRQSRRTLAYEKTLSQKNRSGFENCFRPDESEENAVHEYHCYAFENRA